MSKNIDALSVLKNLEPKLINLATLQRSLSDMPGKIKALTIQQQQIEKQIADAATMAEDLNLQIKQQNSDLEILKESMASAGMDVEKYMSIAQQRADILIAAFSDVEAEPSATKAPKEFSGEVKPERRKRRTKAEMEADRLAQTQGSVVVDNAPDSPLPPAENQASAAPSEKPPAYAVENVTLDELAPETKIEVVAEKEDITEATLVSEAVQPEPSVVANPTQTKTAHVEASDVEAAEPPKVKPAMAATQIDNNAQNDVDFDEMISGVF